MKSKIPVVLILILVPFAYAYYLYPSLPYRIPTHFNASGEADAWGHKSSIFLLPSIMGVTSIIVYFILSNIKKLDPKRYASVDDKMYKQLALYVVVFLSLLSLLLTYASAHEGVKIEKLLFPFLGLAFAGFGVYMPKIKQNYFAGFRLPWTLESEANWTATHRLAGKIWTVGGLLQFLSGLILQGELVFIFFISIIIFMVIIPTVYSYLFFKKEKVG
ncbi:MAG: Immunity protein SdpI [Bacteroidota bacterium]